MKKFKFKTLAIVLKQTSSSMNELDRLSLLDNMSLTYEIHDLLNQLNQYGTMINECSKKKSIFIKQLQNEMDQINELSQISVLNNYFQLLFRLETYQQQIKQTELFISDLSTEIYMIKHIIIQMIHIDKQTDKLINSSSYSTLSLKNLLMKNYNKKQNDDEIVNNNNNNNESNYMILKNLFKFWRNTKYNKNDNCNDNEQQQQQQNNNDNAYVETIEHLKMKLKTLIKDKQWNEKSVQQLTKKCSSLMIELKHYHQRNSKELSANQLNLNNYYRFRLRTKKLQNQILLLEQSIQDYRQQYRDTMERINVISDSIHKIRNNNKIMMA